MSEESKRDLSPLERAFAAEAARVALLDHLFSMPLAIDGRALSNLLAALGVDPRSYAIVRASEEVRR
jgi:hypothetical protein